MGQLIKGKPVADKITEDLKLEVEKLNNKGIHPKLQVIRVGAREDDLSYERGALKRMASCGILTEVKELPLDINQDDFIKEIKNSNDDKSVHGILIFRPLPKQLDENVIKYVIDPKKDIDCFSPVNVAKLTEGDKTGYAPCTPSAVMEMLKFYNVELTGKNVVVLGRSMVVGKPQALLLLGENATVTICHSKTREIAKIAASADIVIAAIGKARMVGKEFVKEGAVIIDVGINVDETGNLCGDVNTDECLELVSLITPVPAGVGAVTTSVLAKHVVQSASQSA